MIKENIKLLILNKKFVIICFLLLFLNGVIVYKKNIDAPISPNEYKEAMIWVKESEDPLLELNEYMQVMFTLPQEDLLFADTLYYEYTLTAEVKQYIEGIHNYKESLQSVINNVRNLEFFDKSNTDKSKSRESTIEIYSSLMDQSPTVGAYKGVEEFTNLDITELFVFLVILAACSFLILEEKERGMFTMIKTMAKGRVSYFAWKTLSLLLMVVVIGALFQIENLILYKGLYGFDHLSVPIQSVPGFLLCPYNISILEYIGLFFLLKMIAYLIIALFIIAICQLSMSQTVVYMISCLAAMGSFVLYQLDINSSFYILKYLNFFAYLDVSEVTRKLNYITFHNREMRALFLQIASIVVLIPLFFTFGMFHYLNYKGATKKSYLERFQPLLLRFSTLGNEIIKVMVFQGGLLIFIGFVFTTLLTNNFETIQSDSFKFYKSYVDYVNSMELEDSIQWIDERLETFQEFEEKKATYTLMLQNGELDKDVYDSTIKEIDRQLEMKIYINILKQQSESIKEIWTKENIRCDYVFEPFYDHLYGKEGNSDRYMNGIILALFAVCMIVPICSYDNQYKVDQLLKVTVNGCNKLIKIRAFLSIFLLMLIQIVSKFVWVISVIKRYGLPELSSSIQSVPYFREMGFSLNIREFILISSIIEAVIIISVGLILFAISLMFRDVVLTLLVGLLVCVCPVILGYIGFAPAKYYWLTPFFVPSMFIAEAKVNVYTNLIIITLGSIYCYRKYLKKWRGYTWN